MPPTVRASNGSQTGSSTVASFSPAMPAGIVAGDLLIGIACNGGGDVPATRPSGSTAVLNVDDGTVYNIDVVRKVAVGGDVFTWTTATARKWAGLVVAVTVGTFNTTTPVQGQQGVAKGTTSDTAWTTPASTPAGNDTLMISAFGAQISGTWSTTNTAPTMTEIGDLTTTATTAAALGVYRSDSAPAVASITRSAVSSVASANGGSLILFVNPAAAPDPRKPNIPSNRQAVHRASRW